MAGWVAIYLIPSPILMVVGAILISILLAAVAALLLLRLHTVYFAIVSLAMGQMLFWMAREPAYAITGGENGLTQIPIDPLFGMFDLAARLPEFLRTFVPDYMYLMIAVGFVLTVVFVNRVLKSPYGLIFKGIRENETRTSFVGLSTWKYKFSAFLMSAAISGLAGGLATLHNNFVGIRRLLWEASGDVVVITVLGGIGSLAGPVLGAFVYLWFEGVVNTFDVIGEAWQLMLAIVFTAIVWRYPGGIWAMLSGVTGFVRSRTESSTREPAVEPQGGDD
jgi:branched-chain amino acid transport system permease protein